MKTRRILSLIIVSLLVAALLGSATASASVVRASPTLSSYGAVLTKGSNTGKFVITYDVSANNIAESLGVSYMKIYKSGGDYVTTIYATNLNGFKASGTMSHRNSYTYTGTSGTSYYAEVTVFATIDGVTDSRTVTTNTVKAP